MPRGATVVVKSLAAGCKDLPTGAAFIVVWGTIARLIASRPMPRRAAVVVEGLATGGKDLATGAALVVVEGVIPKVILCWRMPGGAAMVIASLAAGCKDLAAGAAFVIIVSRHGTRRRQSAHMVGIGRTLNPIWYESGGD
jgi:hypothetical protein